MADRNTDIAFAISALTQATMFAADRHREHKRKDARGTPYINHPIMVVNLMANIGGITDIEALQAGMLHDTVEDTEATITDIEENFGSEVALLVDGVSKLDQIQFRSKAEAQAESFRKMMLAMIEDIRVILVKLADRLHNMQTLEHMPIEARRRIARETLEIYAPTAHRLGMSKVQRDLQDLAFFHLHPQEFSELRSQIQQKVKLGRQATEKIRTELVSLLSEAGLEVEISFRVKRFYSIYQKLRRQGIDASQLYDYLAFRIVTESVRDCYACLGVVHQAWRPVPGRFKDYIAMPKPNLYQSLHTTLVSPSGELFEVQIRTRQMHEVAETGVAAHWSYRDGVRAENPFAVDPAEWISTLSERVDASRLFPQPDTPEIRTRPFPCPPSSILF